MSSDNTELDLKFKDFWQTFQYQMNYFQASIKF